ncbi:hypothetical protein GOBAR_AA20807 [Gossypium barbadense]|uniref:Uncharacterized protein n=1 Tax=Gossypium barbadense TaxID=3634 RepID=A0A2P5X951_GOSBA|nr:hypothetical protein GOBAR_AA20807 [Gossypium barbadense]
MDLRAGLKAQHNRHKIDTRAIIVVVSSKEETNSSRIKSHHKRRVDRTGTSTMVATTLASPLVSLQNMAHESSPIIARGNSPSPCISPPTAPLVRELPAGNSGKLALSHYNLNSKELKGIVEKWRALVLEAAKKKICADDSFGSSQKSALLTLSSSLQAFFIEASKIRIENDVLYKQNDKLIGKLITEQVKNDALSNDIAALDAELIRVVEKHKAVVNHITAEHKAATAELKRKQEEAFEGFKKNTLGMLSDVTPELKSNILLHAQVIARPFEFTRLIAMLPLSLSEPTIMPIGDDITVDPTIDNAEVVEGEGGRMRNVVILTKELNFNCFVGHIVQTCKPEDYSWEPEFSLTILEAAVFNP